MKPSGEQRDLLEDRIWSVPVKVISERLNRLGKIQQTQMSPNISGLTCTNTSRTPAYCCSPFRKCLILFRFRRPCLCAWAFCISSIASCRSANVAYWNLLLRSGVKRRLKLSHTRVNEVLIVACVSATATRREGNLEIKSKVGRTKAGKKLVIRRSEV